MVGININMIATENIQDVLDFKSNFWESMASQLLIETKGMNGRKRNAFYNAISGKELIKSVLNIECDFEGSIGDDIDHESVRLIRGKDILIVAATNKKRINRLLDEMISKVLVEPKYSNTLNFKNDIVHIYTFDMTHMSNND